MHKFRSVEMIVGEYHSLHDDDLAVYNERILLLLLGLQSGFPWSRVLRQWGCEATSGDQKSLPLVKASNFGLMLLRVGFQHFEKSRRCHSSRMEMGLVMVLGKFVHRDGTVFVAVQWVYSL